MSSKKIWRRLIRHYGLWPCRNSSHREILELEVDPFTPGLCLSVYIHCLSCPTFPVATCRSLMYRCYRDLDIIAVSLISALPKQIANFRRNAIATSHIVFQLHIKHNSNCSHCIPAAHQTQQQLLTLYSSCTSNSQLLTLYSSSTSNSQLLTLYSSCTSNSRLCKNLNSLFFKALSRL